MNNRLYVGNLSYSTTKDALQSCFAECGVVVEAHLPMDRETGRPRGFAFVTMGTDEEATKAIEQLNGMIFEGRPLRVNLAEERGARGAGGGAPAKSYSARADDNNISEDISENSNRNARGGHRGW